jgi:predicted transposase YdaD
MEESYEEGMREGRVKAMLADGMDVEQIARYTGLSVEEVERIGKEMSS